MPALISVLFSLAGAGSFLKKIHDNIKRQQQGNKDQDQRNDHSPLFEEQYSKRKRDADQ